MNGPMRKERSAHPPARRVRILVFAKAAEADAPALEAAYRRISPGLAGTAGLLGNELLNDPDDPGGYVVMSEWESLAAFHAWEQGPAHQAATSPLRPFIQGAAVYEVVAWH
jgi:heme oxygenase (mycobilin-producing)